MITLRRRLLLAFAGLALAPITVIGVLVTIGTLRFAEKRAQEDLTRRLHALSDLIDAELDAERLFLFRMCANWTVRPDLSGLREWLDTRERMMAGLSSRLERGSRIVVLDDRDDSAWVIERRSAEVLSSPRLSPVERGSLPAAYRELADFSDLDGRLEPPSPITEIRPTGAIVAVAGLRGPRPGIAGLVLVEEIPVIALLETLLERPLLRDLERTFVTARASESGEPTVLFHSDLTRIGLPLAADDAALAPEDRRFEREGDRLAAATGQPLTGWRLAASVSVSPLLQPIRQSMALFLGLLVLIALLVVGGILHVTRGIGNDVDTIAGATAAIARGDFDRTVRLERADEFSVIADHLNRMAQELRLTAESRAVASTRARLVHDLKGVMSQMKLLLHNSRENLDDPEFRAEFYPLMQGLIERVESLGLELRRGAPAETADLAPVNLDEVVASVLEGPVVSSRPGVVVERDLRAAAAVTTDAALLRRIVENVVTNAVEAMDGRGRLRVRTGDLADAKRTHFVEVADSGPGMSREFVEVDLFRPFATTKRKGIGLGMYQARQAAERLGGKIRVSSEPGRGTRVRVEIGRAEA